MSATPSQPPEPSKGGSAAGRKHLATILVAVLVGAAFGLAGYLWNRVVELEERQAASERWTEFIERKLHESRDEAYDLRSQAEAAQTRAVEAEQDARDTARARRDAELEREFAREESERARLRAERSQREVDRLRKQREQELRRMEVALSRIAETARTPMGMVVNLGEDSFLFDFDKTTLRPENREILSRIAGVLLASHGYRLQVYGHTDDLGPGSYNQQLSEGRAKSVRDYLVDAGVSADIIDVQGFGESSPAAQTKDRQGRQKNRRVEIGVIDTVIDYTGVVER